MNNETGFQLITRVSDHCVLGKAMGTLEYWRQLHRLIVLLVHVHCAINRKSVEPFTKLDWGRLFMLKLINFTEKLHFWNRKTVVNRIQTNVSSLSRDVFDDKSIHVVDVKSLL